MTGVRPRMGRTWADGILNPFDLVPPGFRVFSSKAPTGVTNGIVS
ncbi:MAG: hypothetical protein AB1861_17820 [Cyanobacteriota bacterium]